MASHCNNAYSVKLERSFAQLKELLFQGVNDCLAGPAPVLVHFNDYTTETQLRKLDDSNTVVRIGTNLESRQTGCRRSP